MAKMTWKTKEQLQKEEVEQQLESKKQKEVQEQAETVIKFLQHELDRLIEAEELTEEQKQEFLNLYDPFEVGKSYAIGDKVRHDGVVYEVIQSHTSQSDWLPADVPALFKVYLQKSIIDDEEEVEVIHEWQQPTGAHDAYSKGDKVKFEEKTWVSNVDSNVWKPTEYGWTELNGGE